MHNGKKMSPQNPVLLPTYDRFIHYILLMDIQCAAVTATKQLCVVIVFTRASPPYTSVFLIFRRYWQYLFFASTLLPSESHQKHPDTHRRDVLSMFFLKRHVIIAARPPTTQRSLSFIAVATDFFISLPPSKIHSHTNNYTTFSGKQYVLSINQYNRVASSRNLSFSGSHTSDSARH